MRHLIAHLLLASALFAPSAALACGMYIPKHEVLLTDALDAIDQAVPAEAKPIAEVEANVMPRAQADSANAAASTQPAVVDVGIEEPAS